MELLSYLSRSVEDIFHSDHFDMIKSYVPEQLKEYVSTSTILLVAFNILLIAFIAIRSRRATRLTKLPPGPTGLPVIGYLPFLTLSPHKKLHELSKKYGNVFGLYLGSHYVVILDDYEAIKDAFSKEELLARSPKLNVFKSLGISPSLGDAHGPLWKEHRRFALHTFRDLGFGKSRMESQIKDEISVLLESISKEAGKPCDVHDLITPSMSNNVCVLVFGRRYEYDEPRRKELDAILHTVPKRLGQASIQAFFPWILKISTLLPFGPFKELISSFRKFKKLAESEIEQHANTLDSNDTRDYIDAYLLEMEKRKDDPKNYFTRAMLTNNVMGFFGAGSETVRTTIDWCLIVMASFPKIQEEVHKEIDDVIGRKKSPSWSDQSKMVYISATIMEVFRWKTIVPICPARCTLADTQIQGYDIPANTPVLANIWGCHHDPNYWKEPFVFNPKRFINEDGTLGKEERVIPFSIGKRACPGEALARSEVFLYFVSILQRFRIELADGKNILDKETLGIALQPKPFKLVFYPRYLKMSLSFH